MLLLLISAFRQPAFKTGHFTGTEGAAWYGTGSIQENSGWRRHGYVEDQIHTTPNRGNDFANISYRVWQTVSRMICSRTITVPLSSVFSVCGFNQAAKRGLLVPGRGRGGPVRGRGSLRARGRGSRGRGRGVPRHAVVDHRPRALEISGFSEADGVDLLPHFAVSLDTKHTQSTWWCIFFFWIEFIDVMFAYVDSISFKF